MNSARSVALSLALALGIFGTSPAGAQQAVDAPKDAETPKAAEPSPGADVPKAAGPSRNADGKRVRMGVAMTAIPKISSQVPGASCLLCLAAAHGTVSTLKDHLGTLPTDDLLKVKAEVADLLRKKGHDVVVVAEELDLTALPDFGSKGAKVAKKDFSPLRQKYNLDKLLVIEIVNLGVIRNFSAYIPKSDPKAVVNIMSYIVNLDDNAYDVRRPVNIIKAAEGNWDEPPKFPGMTNAYFQTIELARDRLREAFED
jgi:hypothetical protein